VLNFIAIGLQLYNIFKIHESHFWHTLYLLRWRFCSHH